VERRPHPSDRRARCLYLTDKVHPMLDSLQEISSGIRAEAVAGIPSAEFEHLLDMLERIKTNLSSLECTAGTNKETGA
jgi:DNA-binding MarR family transcriptional regulator